MVHRRSHRKSQRKSKRSPKSGKAITQRIIVKAKKLVVAAKAAVRNSMKTKQQAQQAQQQQQQAQQAQY